MSIKFTRSASVLIYIVYISVILCRLKLWASEMRNNNNKVFKMKILKHSALGLRESSFYLPGI